MLAITGEIMGYFFGIGFMAEQFRSPYTIGEFEAHGLACIGGIYMMRAASMATSVERRRGAHLLGIAVHVLLGGSNLTFWPSYQARHLVAAGYISTAIHIVLVAAQAACLWSLRSRTRQAGANA
jgi:hypothetical protein